jgi:predicted CopG family antitoxin
MAQQVTITVSEEVYQGLQTVAGSRTVGEFLEELARPGVAESQLEAAYQEMMLDADRERAAAEWIEGLTGDSLAGDGDVAR